VYNVVNEVWHQIITAFSILFKCFPIYEEYALRPTNLFFLYGIQRNCNNIGRNLVLYLCIKRVMKLSVLIIHLLFI